MSHSFNLLKFNSDDGVYILSALNKEFERIYIKVRDKEQRIYSDEELRNLPLAWDSNPHKKEWDLRAKSFQRFINYLQTKKQNLNILDLGCGNCWFSGQLSKSFNHNFYCVDVNLTELKQGRRNFDSANLNFIYGDIFTAEFPVSFYDMIIVNAVVQYFSDLKQLINRLFNLSTEFGEIHIIDSPIYTENEVLKAKQRTQSYYTTLGFPEMVNNYHHHTWNDFSNFNYKVLYSPYSVTNRMKNILIHDSPFSWLKIIK